MGDCCFGFGEAGRDCFAHGGYWELLEGVLGDRGFFGFWGGGGGGGRGGGRGGWLLFGRFCLGFLFGFVGLDVLSYYSAVWA